MATDLYTELRAELLAKGWPSVFVEYIIGCIEIVSMTEDQASEMPVLTLQDTGSRTPPSAVLSPPGDVSIPKAMIDGISGIGRLVGVVSAKVRSSMLSNIGKSVIYDGCWWLKTCATRYGATVETATLCAAALEKALKDHVDYVYVVGDDTVNNEEDLEAGRIQVQVVFPLLWGTQVSLPFISYSYEELTASRAEFEKAL